LANRVWKKWEIFPVNGLEEELSIKEMKISPLMARVLFNRGVSTADQARRFLSPTLSDLPNPLIMKDME
jgi:single-stranded-DNA-specific exonuclease